MLPLTANPGSRKHQPAGASLAPQPTCCSRPTRRTATSSLSSVKLRWVSIAASVLPSGCTCETTRLKSASGLRTPVCLHGEAQVVAPCARRSRPFTRSTSAGAASCKTQAAVAWPTATRTISACVPPLREELPHGIRDRAVAVEPAVAALEIGEAGDRHRFVGYAFARISDEGRDRCRDTSDGANATGFLDDVDTWIADLDHGAVLLRLAARPMQRCCLPAVLCKSDTEE